MRRSRVPYLVLGVLVVAVLAFTDTASRVIAFVSGPTDRDTLHSAQVRIASDSLRTYGGTLARRLGTRIDSLETVLLTPAVTPPPPPPPPPPPGSVAELPRDTVPIPAAPTVCTTMVNAGMNLQAAINAAVSGNVLCLANSVWTGPITLPVRADTNWVTIRPQSTDAAFALPGVRIRPTTGANLPRIQGSGSNIINVATGAIGWRLVGLNIVATGLTYGLVEVGSTSRSVGAAPRKIVLERMWIHGTTTLTVRRCVSLQSGATVVMDSWLDDCHEKGSDSQAIWGANGPGPYRIVNNTLKGAGENIMFGGADPAQTNLVPSDITIRRNHFYTPLAWKGLWTKKNLFELKNARRVLVEDNVFDGSWLDGQDGYWLVLKTANQSGGCTWCITADATVRYNYVKNVSGGVYFIGLDGTNFPADSVARRLEVDFNWIDSVNTTNYKGIGRQVAWVANAHNTSFKSNVFNVCAGCSASFYFVPSVAADTVQVDKNVMLRSAYDVIGCGTSPPWNCAQHITWNTNAYVGTQNTNNTYPATTVFYSTVTAALAAGHGISLTTIQARTSGVVVVP